MELEKTLKISRYLDTYGKMLSENQLKVMRAYFFEDETLSEIAENFDISRQAVLDAIKKSKDKLEEFEDKFGLCMLKQSLEKLINDYNENNFSKEIFINRITKIIEEI